MAVEAFDGVKRAWANLNERERRLVTLMGAVFAALVMFLTVYLSSTAISDVEQESEQISKLLRDIRRARAKIRVREAERQALERRYNTKAPPLGSFLEGQATTAGLRLQEVNDQPEKVSGSFHRRSVRASLPGVGLRPVIEMIDSITKSPYPVAIERLQIEHFQPGDRYNVQLGVLAYDRTATARAAATGAPRTNPPGTAGPPPPP